jgi:demethylmenaquinone methyltransferase/2-methoxy-6-polyprenyl-1,4-benzoquinol methylase
MNDVEAEYKYLRPSIERFPTGPELVDLALAAGFEEVTHYELQPGGLMGCLVCQV